MIGKPVWGIQFRPEMELEDGNTMINDHFIRHPDERRFLANELEDAASIAANPRIFDNFAAACSG